MLYHKSRGTAEEKCAIQPTRNAYLKCVRTGLLLFDALLSRRTVLDLRNLRTVDKQDPNHNPQTCAGLYYPPFAGYGRLQTLLAVLAWFGRVIRKRNDG